MMSIHPNAQRLSQMKSAVALALQEIKRSSNLRQDIACKERQILESLDVELTVSSQGSKAMDDFPTRYLFADPRVRTPDSDRVIVDLARFLMRHRRWRMASGLLDTPASDILNEMRSEGISPPLAFEMFLGYFQTEASDSGMQALTA